MQTRRHAADVIQCSVYRWKFWKPIYCLHSAGRGLETKATGRERGWPSRGRSGVDCSSSVISLQLIINTGVFIGVIIYESGSSRAWHKRSNRLQKSRWWAKEVKDTQAMNSESWGEGKQQGAVIAGALIAGAATMLYRTPHPGHPAILATRGSLRAWPQGSETANRWLRELTCTLTIFIH